MPTLEGKEAPERASGSEKRPEEETEQSRRGRVARSRRQSNIPSGGRYRLDNLERQIIRELCEDGRKPFQAIARAVGVDEKTVRNRVSKLREAGILNIIPTGEVNALKGCIVAIIAVNISTDARGNVEGLANDIASLPSVSWVGIVMGQYDLLVEVIVENWEELTQFEFFELPSIAGVGKTDSFLVLSHHGKRGVPFVEPVLRPLRPR